MKNNFTYIIILTALFVAAGKASAQNKLTDGKLYGIITDSTDKQPLGLVTLNLKTEKDSLIKAILNKPDGRFTFDALTPGKYHLVIVSAGYQAKLINISLNGARLSTNIDTVYLNRQVKDLKEVTIIADRPIVQQKADRIVYDLQADPESKAKSVLDMMRKIPFLSVDVNDNVRMKGNTNFKVLVNGKPSGMMDNNLKEVLKSMPASTVVRIEVITIPPSKYDAEGLAGIINIITAKKVSNGYKGTLNFNESFPQGGPGTGGSFTAQQGKLGINAYGGANTYTNPQTIYSVNRTTTGTEPTVLQQNGYNRSSGKSAYLGTELSYEIDTLNLLSGDFNISGNRDKGRGYQTSLLNGTAGALEGYNLDNNNYGNGGGFDAAINYQLGFKESKNSLLTFSYQYSGYGSNSHTGIALSNPVNYQTPDYKQADNQNSTEQTFQVDYAHSADKLNIEAGLKGILRNSKSNFEYRSFNAADNLFKVDPDMGNMFNYTQNVFGAYNSCQYSIKTWSINGGLRAEFTDVNADFVSTASGAKQNYFNVIPTIAVNKSFADKNSINFGFTQRIRRPSIYRLNPFVDRSNPDFVSMGNPNLRAVLMNIIQLGYSNGGGKKLSVFLGADYTFVNNLELQVTNFNPATQVTTSTYANTGKGGGAELNANISYAPGRLYNLNLNGNALNLSINGTGADTSSKLHMLMWHISVSNGFKFDKGWSANANMDYNSRSPNSLQSVSNAFFSTSVSVSKEVIKNKLFFSASVNNPVTKFRNNIITTTSPDFVQVNNNQMYFRSVNFSLNYNFGRLKKDIKKSRRDINNDDVSNKKSGL